MQVAILTIDRPTDLIYGRLAIIINSYVRNSVDENTLDHVAFLSEVGRSVGRSVV